MTDLEITKLCAVAMDYTILPQDDFPPGRALRVRVSHADKQSLPSAIWYWPLKDDAQAMALVKKFGLDIHSPPEGKVGSYEAAYWEGYGIDQTTAESDDLNRAICECVAKRQAAKPSGARGRG